MPSGGVEADDFFIATRDRARRRGPRARGRCSRRLGAPRAGAGTVPLRVVLDCGGATWRTLRPSTWTRPRTPAPMGGGALRRAPGPSLGSPDASSMRPGATPPRLWSPTAAWSTTAATSCAGRSSARSPRLARPGESRRRREDRYPAIMKHIGEHFERLSLGS